MMMNVVRKLSFQAIIIIFATRILVTGCSSGIMDLGDEFINTPTYTALIDTVSIQLSTLKVDSVKTSASGTALAGHCSNAKIGKTEAISYMQFSLPTGFSIDKDEVYDSVCFVTKYSGYYLGDTAVTYHLNVHQLTEEIETNEDDNNLYNTSYFAYEAATIGSHAFIPQPSSGKEIRFRLDDALGKSFYNYLLDHNRDTPDSEFKKLFPGVALKSDPAQANTLLGFVATDTTTCIRLYTHLTEHEQTDIERNFGMDDPSCQFNQIINDNAGLPYEVLENGKDLISEFKTNGEAFIQAGNGYHVRIDFPYLNNLLEIKEEGHVVRADLIMKPLNGTYKPKDLPQGFTIAEISRANTMEQPLLDTSGQQAQTGFLVVDNQYDENTYYSYDLTGYLNYRLQENIIDPDKGLVLSFPEGQNNTIDYLIFGGHTNKTSKSYLRIYYYYYDKQ
ncbi:DUF4270 family protein [Marinilabiliaceae bacterium JC017]|nr:DUF4270 family protein [Marinilabiliaceae bacterium JC017]